jgi:hypothetical protein
LSEREAEKQRLDDLGLRLECLRDTAFRCAKTIERMNAQHVDRQPLIDQLRKVAAAAQPLPETLSGRAANVGRGEPMLVSLGGAVKEQILRITFVAIAELEQRDKKEAEIRASAVALMTKTESDIARLEAEAA